MVGAGMFGRSSDVGGDGPGDNLYKQAAQEGIVNFYGTLAQINAEKILPVFEKTYPGVSGRAQQLVDAIQNIEQNRDTGELAQLLTTDS
jgi:hypothetical protein